MSAISDDPQDGLAINRVQPKKPADLQFALDQHATVAVTDIRGIVNSVNQKFCVIHQYAKVGRIGQNHRLLNSGCHPKSFSSSCTVPLLMRRFGTAKNNQA